MSYLREFSFLSVLLRLILATIVGAIIGYGRTKKKRTAGIKIYMLTCIGATLSVLLSVYQYEMMKNGAWAPIVAEIGLKYDASRFGSQVISGIGFLAAGSIVASEHLQTDGLTSATGLFASVCMGLACGLGFYECVILSALAILFVLDVMLPLEAKWKRRFRNITVFIAFEKMEDIADVIQAIEAEGAKIYDINVERTKKQGENYPSAIFSIKMARNNNSHSAMMSTIAMLPMVYSAEELIS